MVPEAVGENTRETFTEAHRTLGALLRRPYDALQGEVYRRLAEEGFADLRAAHSPVLRHILPEGSRAVDLAAAAGMTKQSMAYLIDDLAEKGYVELRPDPADRRAKLAVPTPKAKAAQEAALRISLRQEAAWATALGEEAWATTRRTLERLGAMLEG